MWASLSLPSSTTSTRTLAPRSITSTVTFPESPERLCKIELVTSELVTNSILHSRSGDSGKVTVLVIDLGARVRVEVVDEGSDKDAHMRSAEAGLADHGRGLWLVQQFASSWGT